MIPVLRTLTGDIPLSGVAGILPHEHLTVDLKPIADGGNRRPDRDLVWDDLHTNLQAALAAGVDTLVECTPPHLGRDVPLMRNLAQATGLRVIVATGLYRDAWLPADLRAAPLPEVAAWMTQEISGGFIDGGVWARAGFIKLGVSRDAVTEAEARAVEAGAQAALATGAAIMVHCGVAARAIAVLETLERAGVDPARAVFAHMDGEADVSAVIEVARRGAAVEFDHVGGDDDPAIVGRVRRLADAGQLHRVLLSHDHCGHVMGHGPSRPGPLYTTVHGTFTEQLRDAGFSRDDIRTITRDTPLRALALHPP